MPLLRRYHRIVRVLLFLVLLAVIIMAWQAAVDPHLLDLANFGEFIMTFVLIALAAVVTHRIARWVAPAAKGQRDEDSDAVVTVKEMADE